MCLPKKHIFIKKYFITNMSSQKKNVFTKKHIFAKKDFLKKKVFSPQRMFSHKKTSFQQKTHFHQKSVFTNKHKKVFTDKCFHPKHIFTKNMFSQTCFFFIIKHGSP